MSTEELALARLTARCLQSTAYLTGWSVLIFVLHSAIFLAVDKAGLIPSVWLGLALLLALCSAYVACRVRLDAGLFWDIAEQKLSLLDLDKGLSTLFKPPLPRTLAQRAQGALQWLRYLIYLLMAQILCLALFLINKGFNSACL